ncbi:hypothetical protein T492DRAFT_856157 [Pavlovales sp. CCMP2436]|nr:hypothetical protein T492DRAFT_856157 [Pavlovales sp. CCMP2436]
MSLDGTGESQSPRPKKLCLSSKRRGPAQVLQALRLNIASVDNNTTHGKPASFPGLPGLAPVAHVDERPTDRGQGAGQADSEDLLPSACACQICGAQLGSLTLDARQAHVNMCLDALPAEGHTNVLARPAAPTFWQLNPTAVPDAAASLAALPLECNQAHQHIECPMCARDITALSVAERVRHVDVCGSADGEAGRYGEPGRFDEADVIARWLSVLRELFD